MKFAGLVVSLALGSASAFTAPSTFTSRRAPSNVFAVDVVASDEAKIETAVSAMAAPVEEGMDVEMPMKTVDQVIAEEEPAVDCIMPGRYNEREESIAMPFLKRPTKLDGSHAGDYGFDPLGLSETNDLYTMQEAEIRHARLAMLAVVGWPLSELLAPQWMLQNGCAPSVLNGFNPVSFIAVLGIFAGVGFFEYKTSLRQVASTPSGKLHREDMKNIWEYGVAGDYGFDPLNLYSSIGDSAVARKGLRDVEISHGRMAMLGITGFAAWEKLTGHAIVENSMFFHPNLLLPLLVAGYFGFNAIYEIENDDRYLFQIRKTSEGEAMLENMKLSIPSVEVDPDAAAETVEKISAAVETLKETYKKVSEGYLEYSTRNLEKKD